MPTFTPARRRAQLNELSAPQSDASCVSIVDEALSPIERKRIQIAFLRIREQRHLMRLGQIRIELRALLAAQR